MRRSFLMMVAGVLSLGACAQEAAGYAFDRGYVGGAGTLVLPQGGSSLHRLGGGVARFGYYATEALAFEGEAAWMENKAGLSAKALWHLQGWEFWGKLFGYERLDPFLTVGAKGWVNHGQVGPVFGLGALYYLTDSWALRADVDVTLGLDSDVEAVHALSLGVQYSF